tara:strand:- start:19 stop:255 length:237 start_codon:yes stop_codon:yes gene_type:complete
MKTLANQDNSNVIRVSDDRAEILVEEGYHYIPKSEWKKHNSSKAGDVGMERQDKHGLVKNKSNKMSKSTKRHLRNQRK